MDGFTMKLGRRIVLRVLPRLRGDSASLSLCLAASLVLFVLCFLRYWVGYDMTSVVPDAPEPWRIAHSLRATGHFSNPFDPLETGPSAHLAPAFPTFLALMTKVFGVNRVGGYAYVFAATLAVSILLGLFPLVSRFLGMGVLTGILAAGVWLVAKPPIFASWEVTYAGVLIAIATCCFLRILRLPAPSLGDTLRLGFLIGFLTLLIPTCIPVFLCWLIWLAFSWKASMFRAPAVILILLPVLMVSPWIVRNYLVFDRIILVRDNLGLELSVSNNDCAAFGLRANMQSGCFQDFHPNGSVGEAAKVLAMGEARYNELRLHQAVNWIAANLSRFTSLCAQRLVAFWLPHESDNLAREMSTQGRRRERCCVYIMTFLSMIGLWVTARRDIKSAAVCAIWLGVFPIIYYVVQYEDRYRYPIMWVTFLLGAVPLSVVVEWLWNLSMGRVIESIETDR
jgi:hypothetical protein